MIFGVDDKAVLERTIERKTIETTAFADADIPESLRGTLLNQLSLDIFRCRMMIDLADGDLSSLPSNIETLTDGLEATDPSLYKRYMEMLNRHSRRDEEMFLMLFNRLLYHVPDLSAAMGNVMFLLSRKDLFTDGEVKDIVKVRNMMDRFCYVLSNLSDSETVKYSKAMEYASFCSEECSMMLKIQTGKRVTFDEISTHMDWTGFVDRKSFIEICCECMVESELALWESFDNGWDRRKQVYLGRAICDQVFGSPAAKEMNTGLASIKIHG